MINQSGNNGKLLIVWSSGDIEVAKKMVLLYASVMMPRGYWSEAMLMIWGPSAKLLAENLELQEKIKEIKKTGVIVNACVVCSDEYGVSDTLKAIGVELVHTGEYLTNYLKDGWNVITL